MTPPVVHRPRCNTPGDQPGPRWRKSSLSLANGNCVEVAPPHPGGIGVRDSTDPAGPVLRFSPDEWRAFLSRLRKDRREPAHDADDPAQVVATLLGALAPGVVLVSQWRPPATPRPLPAEVNRYGGVGRTPARSPGTA